jgi:hypothetical protein
MQNLLTGRLAVVHPLLVSNDLSNAINATATATAAQMAAGVITSTSASAVAITTPTAAAIYTELEATPGTYYDFIVDNTAGSNTVTVTLDASITAYSAVTGGTTLTVANGHAGHFRIYFNSATAAQISRIV